MDAAHMHLMLNHLPVVGTFVGCALLLFAIVRRSDEVTRVALGTVFVAALLVVPVYLSGEPAEEIVEHRPEVAEPVIERHEEAAELAAVALGLLGIVCVGGLLVFRGSPNVPRRFALTALALTLAVSALMARTANLGGQIRHAEIRAPIVQSGDADQRDGGVRADAGAYQENHDDDD